MAEEFQSNGEDASLLCRAAEGDTVAFAQLHRRHFQAVTNYLSRRKRHCDTTDDIVQEVFFRAWKAAGQFRGQSSARTYLFAIAKNVLREQAAKLRPFAPATAVEAATIGKHPAPPNRFVDLTEVEWAAHRKELLVLLAKRIANLSEESREAIRLSIFQRLSTKEAAARSNCSTDTFRKRLLRAIKVLRNMSL